MEIVSDESFVATSDEHFMLVQYMASCELTDPDPDEMVEGMCGLEMWNQGMHDPMMGTGDPYMVQMVPVEQWLKATPFLTDESYRHDFVTIAREQGTTVDLDCYGEVGDEHFTAIPGTSYEVGQVFLDLDGEGGEADCEDGAQFIEASDPIGLVVGGYDRAASYAYPGGLSLALLWDPQG